MYKVILTAPTLCYYGQDSLYKGTYDYETKPNPRQIDLLQRQFALEHNTELASITVNIVEK